MKGGRREEGRRRGEGEKGEKESRPVVRSDHR
jgi:hypothetical protein